MALNYVPAASLNLKGNPILELREVSPRATIEPVMVGVSLVSVERTRNLNRLLNNLVDDRLDPVS